MPIRKSDIFRSDIISPPELISDGYNIYLSSIFVVSTTGSTKTIVIDPIPDGEGLTLPAFDHPTKSGDIVYIYGSSAADGYYTINSIISDVSFTVIETIVDSIGGNVNFMFPTGARSVGIDPTSMQLITANNLQTGLEQLSGVAFSMKTKLDTIETGAQVVDFPHVASALGGNAGSNVGYTFKSDGAGSGTMVPNTQHIPNLITVSYGGGDVDYTTITDALAAAVTRGASPFNPYLIKVYPGTYVEPPISITTSGITISSENGQPNIPSVLVVAQDPSQDLITIDALVAIYGINFTGVTDPSKACIRITTSNMMGPPTNAALFGCFFIGPFSNGIITGNGSTFTGVNIACIFNGPGENIGTLIKVDGSSMFLDTTEIVVPPQLLPAYGTNPIQTVIYITNGSICEITNAYFVVPSLDNTASTILIDNGSSVSIFSSSFIINTNAIHIGSSGTNTQVVVQGSSFTGNTINFNIESSTGSIYTINSVDTPLSSVVTGGKITGIQQDRSEGATDIIGTTYVVYPTNKKANLSEYLLDFGDIGLVGGGVVTAAGGLFVNVADGYGWIERESPSDDIRYVSWISVLGLSLTASTTNYIFYSESSDSIMSSTSPAGVYDIPLAQAVTDGYGIRFLHNVTIAINSATNRFEQYLLDTRKFVLKNGLVLSQGSSNTKISITSGNYYRATEVIPFPGATDATFSYFYGTNGANEISGQTNIDDGYYDDAGVLTALSDGYFKVDTVYITSDNRIEVIYGTTEYIAQANAEGAAPLPPFSAIEETGFVLANLIIQQGSGVGLFIDKRPTGAASVGSSGGVTVHGQLLGLLADDHPQYLLTNGARAMTGSLNVGGNDINNVNLVDGVVVHAHASRHNPGGIDALAIGTPVAIQIGVSPSLGTAASYALSDHQHGIPAGTAVTIGTSNTAGIASSVSRSDHVHAHGSQTNPSQHALATETTAGFMSPSDKYVVDNAVVAADGYANTHKTLRDLIHFIDDGPASGFPSGSYKEILPAANPFPTSVIWWTSSSKTAKIVEKIITRNTNKTPSTIVWNMYDTDGVTIIQSTSDTITYSSIFEINRTRIIV